MLKLVLLIFMFLSVDRSCSAMPAGWTTRESQHFIVYYRSADKDFVENLLQRSEAYYKSIPENLGLKLKQEWKGSKRSKIYIYDTSKQYQDQTGQPEWSDGSSIQKLRVIFSFLGAKNFSTSALPHELAHIIFREAVGFQNKDIPVWLEEGVGSSQEEMDFPKVKEVLKNYLAENKLIAISELQEKDLRALQDKAEIDLFYAQAASIVGYLLSEFGPDHFRIFCQNLENNLSLEKALEKAYGFRDIRKLDQAWLGFLKIKGR
jgi:hypothetical protein